MIAGVFLRKVRVALTPRDRLLRSRLSNGAMVFGKNRKGFGGRGVYVFRDSVEVELKSITEFLPANGVLVDVGANTGIYSMKAAQHFRRGGGLVISIEPIAEIAAILHGTVRANGFANVRIRNCCAGAQTGTAELWQNFGRPHSFGLLQRDQTATAVSTLVVALDDLLTWENVERLDYLKLDVEGVEQDVLRGAAKSIARFRPIIQAEVNIHEASVPIPNYVSYQATGSNNRVFIPEESPYHTVAAGLGWRKL